MLSGLFDLTGLAPHGTCLLWREDLFWSLAASDSVIALSYCSISATIAAYIVKRQDMYLRWVAVAFAVFILLCASSHGTDLWTLWYPEYGAQVVVKSLTAAVSFATAAALWPLFPRALALPSAAQLAASNAALGNEVEERRLVERSLRAAEDILRHTQEGLERTVEERTRQLRESEARWQFALEGSGQGVWDWTIPTGDMFFSTRWRAMLGYGPGEIDGRYEEWNRLVHPDDLPGMLAEIQRHLGDNAPYYHHEHRRMGRDGGWLWVLDRGKVVERGADGRPVRMIGTQTDISDRRAAEDEIRRLNSDLERRVDERTAELLAANGELDSFAYAVSHDLRAPLRAMTGFSEALIEDYGSQLDDEARHYLGQIVRGGVHMGELIDGLLRLSRATRGQLQRLPVEISALAATVRKELERSDPGRRVQWDIEPGLVVRGDRSMLEAVLRNLLENAWKYTRDTAEPIIRVFGQTIDGTAFICVADNGAGFDMAHAAKLFEPFQRLHRQDEFPGIGIGLSTVKRIVVRHGGAIEAEGAVGKGACFRFSIPGVAETAIGEAGA